MLSILSDIIKFILDMNSKKEIPSSGMWLMTLMLLKYTNVLNSRNLKTCYFPPVAGKNIRFEALIICVLRLQYILN